MKNFKICFNTLKEYNEVYYLTLGADIISNKLGLWIEFKYKEEFNKVFNKMAEVFPKMMSQTNGHNSLLVELNCID